MIFTSKTVTYTLAGASFISVGLLMALYSFTSPGYAAAPFVNHPAVIVAIDPSTITAKAAIIYDPSTKQVLYAKNTDARLPLASLTKLMSADAVLAGETGSTSVTITAASLKPEGDWGFKVGEVWPVEDLVRFGLAASSNDAMAAAAESLGGNDIDIMNARAKALGLTQTYFYNPTGLDLDADTAGAYGSAHDIAVLASEFLSHYPSFFEATAAPSVSISAHGTRLEATSTTGPLLDIPGLIAAKTGYTDLAGGNLVAAVDMGLNHPLIVAVLGSTVDGRFTDVELLISKAREALAH